MSLINTNIGPERVQVFPVPIGVVQVPGVATSVTAFLISSSHSMAPVNVPTPVTDLETFVSLFGGPTEILYNAYYSVEGFFNNAGTGNTAIIVNVGTSPTANSFIGNAGAGTGLRALDNIDVLGLVCAPGLPLSIKYLVDPAVIDYSKTVRALFGETLSTTFSLVSIPKEISKSNTDVALVSGTTISMISGNVLTVSATSMQLSAITPGMIVKKAGAFVSVITAVDASMSKVTVASLGSLMTSDSIDLDLPSAVSYKNLVVNDPSQAVGWYMNDVLMPSENPLDPPGTLESIDPVGHVAGVMARIDSNISIGGPSHAPAGIQFGGISGINGLLLSLSERTDGEPLRLNFINRITSFPGSGNVIFGAYTDAPMGSTAEQQLIQVIRSLQYIKGSLERGLRGFLWENFSPDTQVQVSRAIESFLRNNSHLFPAGLPEAQQFKVIQVAATQSDLDTGVLRVRVQVKPNTAVRFIEIALEFPLPTA